MPRQNTVDFLSAFAVGTVLGIGATLLLRPEPTPRQRLARQLKPYRKKMRKSYGQASKAVRSSAGATADLSGDVLSAGRSVLEDFRDETAKILAEARAELQDAVNDQVKAIKKSRKRGMFGR